MAYDIIWSPRASLDLNDVIDFYDVVNPNYLSKVLTKLRSAETVLTEHPEFGHPAVGQLQPTLRVAHVDQLRLTYNIGTGVIQILSFRDSKAPR